MSADQLTVFAALGEPEPVRAARPDRRCTNRPKWTPTRAALACADCFAEQHDAAIHGRRVPHRHRVTWVLTSADGTTPLCTRHAANRGCPRAGAVEESTR